MKKITTATDSGGAPIYKSDLREVFGKEIWDTLEGLLYRYQADTQGIIVSGCVITANGGGFDITAGIVYLNGEFMRLAASTALSFPKYIAADTVTNDTRTFADGTSHVVTINKIAGIDTPLPVGVQYIAITNLTDANDRRWNPQSAVEVAAAIVATTAPAWVNVTLLNSWASISGATVQYRHNTVTKTIELRGILDGASAGSAIFADAPNLPDPDYGGMGVPSFKAPVVADNSTFACLTKVAAGWQITAFDTARDYHLDGVIYHTA